MTKQGNCLVLGGGGFIGSTICREAEQRGWKTTAVTRENYAAVRGTACDVLVNANGNSRKYLAQQNPPDDFDRSVRSVAHSLHDFPARHYVYLSTCDVYADCADPQRNREDTPPEPSRLSPYGFHKLLAEELVRRYAVDWTIYRASGFVGPRLWKNSIHDLLTRAPLRVTLDSAYQYLDTRCLAPILFDLLPNAETHRRVFNIGGTGVVRLRDVANWIPGCRPEVLPGSPTQHYEINIERISRLARLPDTETTVRRFIAEWRPPAPAGDAP